MEDQVPSKFELLMGYGQLQLQAGVLLMQSDAYKNQGDLASANTAFDELIASLKEQLRVARTNNAHYPDSPFDLPTIVDPLLNAMLTQADVCETLANWEKAESLRKTALEISEQYLPPESTAERARQQAGALVAQARFNEALVSLANARDRFEQAGDPMSMAHIITDIADVLEWLGDYERALAEVKRARQFIEPWLSAGEGTMIDVAKALVNGQLREAQDQAKLAQISVEMQQIEARINRYLGNYTEAERQFREVMPQIPSVAHPAIDYQLAAILVADGRFEAGLEYVAKLEPTFQGLLRPKLGVLLRLKAEALLGLGRHGQALAVADTALADLSAYRDPDALWYVQWLRARALQALDRPGEALDAYVESANTIHGLRKAPLGYRLDSTYLRDKVPVFEAGIDLACKRDEAETCCRLMEMIKSRILTATLSMSRDSPSTEVSDLDRQVDQLSRQIDALEYSSYYHAGMASPERTAALEGRKEALLDQRAALMEQIRFSDPRWRALTEPVPFDLPATLDLLAARNQAALTLFFRPGHIVAVLLQDNACSTAALSLSAGTQAALAGFQQNLRAKAPQVAWFDPSPALGLQADDLVPGALLAQALEADSVVLVPHGPLHLLPWAALSFQGTRLFERCPLGIVPNLSCLGALQAEFGPPRVGLAGAPDYSHLPVWKPLAYAAAELETIESLYPSPPGTIGNVLIDKAANEHNFWLLAHHPEAAGNILHISCHGDLSTGDPMNSGLLLSDAKVDATEIARRRVQYNEVILSACSTGVRPTDVQGIPLIGDDILGLPGAFLEAGARSVLVSIPPVREDATFEFMTVYHEHRVQGEPPMRALQKTQKIMLSSPLYPPQLWSGFTVYGCQ